MFYGRLGKYGGYILKCILPLMLLYSFSVFFRVSEYKRTRNYNPDDDTHFYNSESAVYYHYTQIFALGEKAPSPDTALQAPEGLYPEREFTLFMEKTAALFYRLLGSPGPLHGFLIWFLAIVSSISIGAAWLAAYRITGSPLAAFSASLLYTTSFPAYIRTLGGLLSENFALPALFLGFALQIPKGRETKGKVQARSILSGILFSVAVMSWHFSQFVLLLVAGWKWVELLMLRNTGQEYKIERLTETAWLFMFLFITGIFDPALSRKMFILSPLMLLLGGLIIANIFPRMKWVTVAVSVFSVLLIGYLLPEHFTDFSHVYTASWEKLTRLGIKPADPKEISFETRMFWAGPFDTPLLSRMITGFGIYLPVFAIFLILAFFSRRRTGGLVRKSDLHHVGHSEMMGKGSKDSKEKELLNLGALTGKGLVILAFLAFIPIYLLNARFCVFLAFFIVQATILVSSGRYRKVLFPFMLMIFLFQSYEMYAFSEKGVTPVRVLLASKLDPAPPLILERARKDVDELYHFMEETVNENSIVLAAPALSAELFQVAGKRVALHPMFEEKEIRDRTRDFYRFLYGRNSDDFVSYAKSLQVSFFVYDVNFLLPSSTSSDRYFGGAGKVEPSMVAYKFHFTPDAVNGFSLVFENECFRVYEMNSGNRNIITGKEETGINGGESFRFRYRPIYDPDRFRLYLFDADARNFMQGHNKAMKMLRAASLAMSDGRPGEALPFLKAAEKYYPDEPGLRRMLEICEDVNSWKAGS